MGTGLRLGLQLGLRLGLGVSLGLGWGMAEGIRRAEVPKGAAEARKAAAEELQAPG